MAPVFINARAAANYCPALSGGREASPSPFKARRVPPSGDQLRETRFAEAGRNCRPPGQRGTRN